MLKKSIAVTALSSLLLASCGSDSTKSTQTTTAADTTKTEIAAHKVTPLPDTCFASVEKVKYQVEVLDPNAKPIDVTKQLYDNDNVLSFRKNPMRNADFGGTVKGTPSTVEVDWKFMTDGTHGGSGAKSWGGGSGWTGQPLYLKKSNEIVVGSLCGKVYFIDYATGKATRSPLVVTNPIKGTVSLDPVYDNLYVGHGIAATRPFGTSTFDLKTHKLSYSVDRDPKAKRSWGAYDSNSISVDDYLFWCAENCSFYKFRRSQGKLTPVATLRYTVNGEGPGIENSLCVYANYGFFGDNNGNVLAVNLDTMKPVWYYDNHDDIDGTIVCQVEDGIPYLYLGSEVDKQGSKGICYMVKLNATNGSLVWEQKIPANRFGWGSKWFDGGLYGTPLLGKGNCEGMMFANIVRNGADGRDKNSGEFTAFDTKTGKILYATPLYQYAWSSPIGYYNENNELFILTGDTSGKIYLIEGKTGKILHQSQIGANFESSPIAIGNTAVVGSRTNGIYKMTIK